MRCGRGHYDHAWSNEGSGACRAYTPSQPPPTPDLRAALERCVESMQMADDARRMDVYDFKAKYRRQEQADKATWVAVSDMVMVATITIASTALETKP